MNRIVREHYPVAALPSDLKQGFPADGSVRVTVQLEDTQSGPSLSLKQLLSIRRPPYRSTEDIVKGVRHDRDAWDE